jgi:CheY-like chemotaxis protein
VTSRIRALVVEDREEDAELVVHALRRGGFDVDWHRVDTEPAFVAAIENGPWDVIISDYSMPGFDGLRAFALHRERASEVPFLFVSGQIGEERAVAACASGPATTS